LISLAITFFLILYFTKKIRAELYDGSVTFKQALLIGVLIAFFASIITSFYGLIQNLLIDPDYMVRYVEAQKIWMYEFMSSRGIPESTIMESLDKIDERVSDYKPVREFFRSIFMGTLLGFIVSLITAAILRKRTQVFE
jgi:flagellar biosynthesis protein FliR